MLHLTASVFLTRHKIPGFRSQSSELRGQIELSIAMRTQHYIHTCIDIYTLLSVPKKGFAASDLKGK